MNSLEEANEIIDFYTQKEPRMQHRYILVLKTTGEKIGTCGFHAWDINNRSVEIGYDLQKAYWHQGYMQEALEAILQYAKTIMNVSKVHACIYIDNHSSIKLVEKFGFVKSATKYEHFREKDYLHYIYTLTF